MMHYNSQKGVSLYYAVLIMSVSLAIALGLNTIIVKSFRTTQEVRKSPAALHAADTGIEYALYQISKADGEVGDVYSGSLDLDNEAQFEVKIISSTSTPTGYECDSSLMYCIYSTGRYQGSKRFIRVER